MDNLCTSPKIELYSQMIIVGDKFETSAYRGSRDNFRNSKMPAFDEGQPYSDEFDETCQKALDQTGMPAPSSGHPETA